MPGETASRKAMQDVRNEKKLIDAKVCAVREVVSNCSTNDIVLALHNFDMDVERTIQAFCEDGAQSALNSWSNGPSKAAKKKKRRAKAKNALQTADQDGTASESLSAASPCPLHSDTPLSPPGSVSNGDLASELSLSNGLVNGPSFPVAKPLPPRVSKPSSSLPVRGPPVSRPNLPLSAAPDDDRPPTLSDAAARKKALAKETKNLSRHDAVIERVQARFNEEVDKANERVRRAFQEMRNLLAEREYHLEAELQRCKEEGHRVLSERAVHGSELHRRSERVAAMSDKELDELRNEIKRFTSERKYEEDLGQTIRFQWQPDPLIEMIKSFGEVVPVKPFLAHKHSSHSSLVSSVGDGDSGLGMISPVSPDEQKAVAQVQGGGITMKSESLTTEQLEDLNRRLQESLQMQGITADILSGVGGSVNMPVRRRPPPASRGARARPGRGRGNQAAGGGASRQTPRLSILSDD